MFIINAPVEDTIEINKHIYLLKIFSPEITSIIKPGQFLNIRVTERALPLLRRPFSVCDVEGEYFYLMFNIMGEGTNILVVGSRTLGEETIKEIVNVWLASGFEGGRHQKRLDKIREIEKGNFD